MEWGYFPYFDLWATNTQALYIFGIVIGAIAWVPALVLAVLDFVRAKRRQVDDIPLGALPIDEMIKEVHTAPNGGAAMQV